VDTVAGGYKAWRSLVVRQVQEMPVASPVMVLDGNTGSAKTEILLRAGALGAQVIDLEGMANHRGSLFGHMAGGQPSQKAFEGRLALALARLDPARPVLVEAESSKIGDLVVPKMLWQAMVAAPRIALDVPVAARADYLVRAYADVTADAARLEDVVWLLRHAHAREVIEGWLALAKAGDFRGLALDLMQRHYDPRYGKHRARMAGERDIGLAAPDLSEASLDSLSRRVRQALG
jgi:tRNA 2-selenouridine synthase